MSEAAQPRRGPLRWLWRKTVHLFAWIGFFLTVYYIGFDLSDIVSGSMSPTLQGDAPEPGDWVLAEKVTYWFRKPRRWEVVRFRDHEGDQVMKRVVGLPGESVTIRDGKIWINGSLVEAPPALSFLHYYNYGRHGQEACPCGDGYFLLGDDSRDSDDSRYNGPIEPGRIHGRAWLRVWPWKRIGRVNP